jgi:hypothetical protein
MQLFAMGLISPKMNCGKHTGELEVSSGVSSIFVVLHDGRMRGGSGVLNNHAGGNSPVRTQKHPRVYDGHEPGEPGKEKKNLIRLRATLLKGRVKRIQKKANKQTKYFLFSRSLKQ